MNMNVNMKYNNYPKDNSNPKEMHDMQNIQNLGMQGLQNFNTQELQGLQIQGMLGIQNLQNNNGIQQNRNSNN